jgi:hypothetical protein
MRVPTIALVTTFVAGSCGGDSFEASYVGCFRDQGAPTSTSGRDLSGYGFQSGSMTIGACISECQSRGFAYAGVQCSTWCFCGNSYGRFGTASNCTMPCGGDSSQTCGGSYANSVYSTNGSWGRRERRGWRGRYDTHLLDVVPCGLRMRQLQWQPSMRSNLSVWPIPTNERRRLLLVSCLLPE